MNDDGYESPDLLPQAEATADAAIAAKPNLLRQWAIRLGLVKPTPFEVPQLTPSERMRLQLQQTFGAPTGFKRTAPIQPTMWRSYAEPAASVVDPAWGDIAAATAQRERITNELGDFSRKVLSNPLFVGRE